MNRRGDSESREKLRRADAAYTSFPDFAAWAAEAVDLAPWDAAVGELEGERQRASPESLRRALDFAVRAAAIDTGAIEGLYRVDRGFTFSVAAQAATWEGEIAEKGPHVRPLFEAQLAGLELVMDAVAARIAGLVRDQFVRELEAAPLPATVEASFAIDGRVVPANSGREFRPVQNGTASIQAVVRSSEPVAHVSWKYQVVVSLSAQAFYAMHLEQMGAPEARAVPLRIRLDLVHPALKTAFRTQLESWVRIQVGELLREARRRIEAAALRSAPS